MNLLIAAQSGFGKSWLTQSKVEKNIPEVDYFVAFDYKDEYRGLVKGFNDVKWHPGGPKEVGVSPQEWADRIQKEKKFVIPRYMVSDDEWRHICASIALAFRHIYERTSGKKKILILIDEAHAVAPERQKFPEPITKLAVVGRGEMVSTIWVTQRLAMLSKNITGQCTARYLGGFMDANDLKSLEIDYPPDLHNPSLKYVPNCPPELEAESGEKLPVRKWVDSNDKLIGSEWIYSDDSGTIRRESTKGAILRTKHYGAQGYKLNL